MIITVFGATGQVGRFIVSQALAKGHSVRAFGRNVTDLIDHDLDNDALIAIKGYVFDASDVRNAVKGSDAVISALGGSFDGTDQTRSLGMKNIIEQMEHTGVKRIVALGGMGILNADEPDEGLLIEQPGYPAEYLPVGQEHLKAYQSLAASSLDWTFVCSPDILNKAGNEQYITAANYAPKPNHYQIAAGDLAHCMIACIEKQQYSKQRVGISRL